MFEPLQGFLDKGILSVGILYGGTMTMSAGQFDESNIRILIKSGDCAGKKPILFGTTRHILAVEH